MFLRGKGMVKTGLSHECPVHDNAEPRTTLSRPLAERLGPFGSWPKDGTLPTGYFERPLDESVGTFTARMATSFCMRPWTPRRSSISRPRPPAWPAMPMELIEGIPALSADISDEDAMRRVLCIHFPHKLSQIFHDSLSHPAVVEALTTVIGPNVKCMQSMLFLKASRKTRPGLAPGRRLHPDT